MEGLLLDTYLQLFLQLLGIEPRRLILRVRLSVVQERLGSVASFRLKSYTGWRTPRHFITNSSSVGPLQISFLRMRGFVVV